ncbi:MAG: L,D-transpeptidase family protein [Xanthobacteraceae bacterium]|nr:L,D-transpeptidase family protein [Xanthobacteraceae bacterium]
MMIRTTLTILAAGALCAAGTSLASAQGYPASQPGAVYSPTLEGYRGAPPPPINQMPDFDDVDDAPAPHYGNSTALPPPGPVMSPEDPRYGRAAGNPQVYSHQTAPQGPVMSPDDPRYGRPYAPPSPAYSDRGNAGNGNSGYGMRPPSDVTGGPGVVTGSVPPMPMGSDGRPTTLSALPPDEQPEADQGGEAQLPPNLRRQEVTFVTKEPAGTIVVDTPNTYLYYVLGNNRAIRYGVRVGRDGFTWTGVQKISRKAEWPDWHPPTEMIERQPYLPRFMAGGPGNPLGARAMYLGSTVYRIHGTNQPSTIGKFVSSGCIGMLNEDVEDLFERAKVGTRVVVLPGGAKSAPAATASARPAPQSYQDSTIAQAGGTAPTVVPPLPAPVSVR